MEEMTKGQIPMKAPKIILTYKKKASGEKVNHNYKSGRLQSEENYKDGNNITSSTPY